MLKTIELAEMLGQKLHKHGLFTWGVAVENRPGEYAHVNYGSKMLYFNADILRHCSPAFVQDEIGSHEVAHALLPAVHKHDGVWSDLARDLGSSGSLVIDPDPLEYEYAPLVGTCELSSDHRDREWYGVEKTWAEVLSGKKFYCWDCENDYGIRSRLIWKRNAR